MSGKNHEYTAITSIVEVTYCEQKVVHDQNFGDKRDLTDKDQAYAYQRSKEGIQAHSTLERAGKMQIAYNQSELKTSSSRCFIATELYGNDAPETNWLRQWRDQHLLPSRLGRAFVETYYLLSPRIIPVLQRHQHCRLLAKRLLNAILKVLGYSK